MYLAPMGCSRFLDNPKFVQCLNMGVYRVLFFSRVITLWESVLWQLPFRSVYLDDHRVHFRGSGTNRSVEDVDELSTKGPQCILERRRSLKLNHGE